MDPGRPGERSDAAPAGVARGYDRQVRVTPKRVAGLVAGLLGGVAYVWVAAVRAVPGVRRRKAEARARRRAGLGA